MGGLQKDTKKIQFEYRRNLAGTTGHERTWHLAGRDREGPGFKCQAPDQRSELEIASAARSSSAATKAGLPRWRAGVGGGEGRGDQRSSAEQE